MEVPHQFPNHSKRFRWNPLDLSNESADSSDLHFSEGFKITHNNHNNNQNNNHNNDDNNDNNSNKNGQNDLDQIGVPFDLAECMTKIARSLYMQDLTQVKEAQVGKKPIYALATSFLQPNYFWLQYSTNKSRVPDSMYQSIMKSINSQKSKNKHQRFIYNEVFEGVACNAQFTDGHYYRALITQTLGGDYVKVLFPDYGNIETVLVEDLTKSGQSHFSVPIQAFCACLYNIRPKHQDLWIQIGERLQKFFNDHLTEDLTVEVRRVRHDYIVDCDIFLTKKDDKSHNSLYRKHIAQEIVDEGLASFIDPRAAHSIKIKEETFVEKKEASSPFKTDPPVFKTEPFLIPETSSAFMKEASVFKKEPFVLKEGPSEDKSKSTGLAIKHYTSYTMPKPMVIDPPNIIKVEIKKERKD